MKKHLFVLLLVIAMLGACKRDAEEKTCSLPNTVSFSKDIIPLFNAHCNTAGCHSGNQPTGGLNLEPAHAYAELTQPGKGYLDTINPPYSLLYAQMISTSTPMPPTGNLPACSTDLVLKWIQQKAHNN